MKVAATAVALSVCAACVTGYCNSATPDGTGKRWGPRTSKAFPPGWNGLAMTPYRGWRSCARLPAPNWHKPPALS
jgi:hypothetical protein|eukprot:COSAG01_NODE_3829_length_5652_cov_6.370250_1_plen_75_part_00